MKVFYHNPANTQQAILNRADSCGLTAGGTAAMGCVNITPFCCVGGAV